MRVVDDERLAALAAQGDERAFAELYRRYGRRLHSYCRSILADDEDAADALQNTMMKALRALRANGGDVRVRPWLYRIAHNESISLIRARRDHEALEEGSGVCTEGPEAHVAAREELDGLVAGVLSLSERRRRALVLRELSGLGYPAIAAALGTTAGAAKQAVYEARGALSSRRSAAGVLGPLAPLWSALTGWLGSGVPAAAKAGALVLALAAGTGTAEELMAPSSPVRTPVAEAAAKPVKPGTAFAERTPAVRLPASRRRTVAHPKRPQLVRAQRPVGVRAPAAAPVGAHRERPDPEPTAEPADAPRAQPVVFRSAQPPAQPPREAPGPGPSGPDGPDRPRR